MQRVNAAANHRENQEACEEGPGQAHLRRETPEVLEELAEKPKRVPPGGEAGENGNARVDAVEPEAPQAEEAYLRVKLNAKSLLEAAERPRAGGLLIFNRQLLSQASRALVREMFRLAWEREGWPLARMGFAEWDR